MEERLENNGFSNKNGMWVISAFLLAALIIRLKISWLDTYLLFQKCVVDDAFFYLDISRNIAFGNGATFDGEIMTNGFHPVYALLLAPVFYFFPTDLETPLHIGLTIITFFNIVTGLLIYLIIKEITEKRAALIGLFLWLFNPYVILISLNGVEAGIATFFTAGTIYFYILIYKRNSYSAKELSFLGILTALSILARVDSVFIFVTLTFTLYCLSYVKEKKIIKSMKDPAIYLLSTFILLGPWFLWNIYHFGTIRQISGVTLPNIAHNMYLMQFKTYFSLDFIKTELFNLFFWARHIIKYSGGILLYLFITASFFLYARDGIKMGLKEFYQAVKIINFTVFAVFLLISFYALYFWGWHRPWYFLSIVMIVTIYTGAISGYILKNLLLRHFFTFSLGNNKNIALACIFIFLSLYFTDRGGAVWEKGLFPFQKQLYDSAVWLKDNTKEDEKIGAISAGIYGHITGRTADLAGVVNEEAYRAMVEKRIFSYLKDKKIDYLVDRADMIEFYDKQFNDNEKGFIKKQKIIKRFGDKRSDIVVIKLIY